MSHYKSQPPPPPPPPYSVALAELKLYQAFIFSLPVFFTFILILLFYLFYLRRRRVDWTSLRMRSTLQDNNAILRAELGLKKELREMLPVIVYKESFFVKDTQCPVCLGDYQAEDRLQQIPACGHTFHMDCIDHWLANHATCPLCRLSLLPSAKVASESGITMVEAGQEASTTGNEGEPPVQPRVDCEDSPSAPVTELGNQESMTLQNDIEKEERGFGYVNDGSAFRDTGISTEEDPNSGRVSAETHI